MVKSSSDEAERMVISRLKAECGNQFTNRFEAMFKDIQVCFSQPISVSPLDHS